MSDGQPRTARDDGIGRILGPIAAVLTIVAIVFGVYELPRLVEGPTVDAGRWFTVNDVHYRVDVIRNDRSGLVVRIYTTNTEDTPQNPGQGIFTLVVRAGDEKVEWDCTKVACMSGVLRPGASRAFTLQFVVTRPADTLEFEEVGNDISNRLARIRLRPAG